MASPRVLVRAAVATTIAGALGFAAIPASSSAATPPLVRDSHLATPFVPSGSTALGAVPQSQAIDFDVVLPPSNAAGLQQLLSELYDPSSPEYHHWLTPPQFDADFGPSSSTISTVKSWLKGDGLSDVSTSGFEVQVKADEGAVSSALGTPFERYRTRQGVTGYAATESPLVPSNLTGGQVQGFVGLSTLSRYQPLLTSGAATQPATTQPQSSGGGEPTACQKADDAGGVTLNEIGDDYDIDSLLADGQNGSGETVALYELAAHSSSDVSTYFSCFGLSNTVNTEKDGSYPASSGGSGTVEADLDIEQVATQAPGATIDSYEEGPAYSDQAVVNVWNEIVNTDPPPPVVSTSWGECEEAAEQDDTMYSIQEYLSQAAAQGESVFAAAGDSGSEDCYNSQTDPTATQLAVDFPASSEYVTAVGGTQFSGTTPVVWDQGNGAGGGGVSSYWPESPTAADTTTCTPASGSVPCRELPDISANADEDMTIFSDNAWEGDYGGTSFAAPLMAGMIADANDGCTATGTQSTGRGNFDVPLDADGASLYGSGLTDVTSGNNDLTGTNGGQYTATTGYDEASGWGTPIATGLSCPEITSIVDNGNGTATVTGLGLEQATIYFGSNPATTANGTTPSGTEATVDIPPGSGDVTVSAVTSGAGSFGTGTQDVTYSYDGPDITTSSLPNAAYGRTYDQQLSETGGSGSESWTVTQGSLPDGLTLTSDGSTATISGTPTALGASDFTVQVKDGDGQASTADLSIDVTQDRTSTSLSAPSSATTGTPFTVTATVSPTPAGGTVTFTANGNTACSDVALSGDTASCSITPSSAGTESITATYSGTTDFTGSSSNTLSVSVSNPAPAPSPAPTSPQTPTSSAADSGYDLVGTDGGVFVFPTGQSGGFYGSLPGDDVSVHDIAGMVPSPDDKGYFLVGADGGVFAFGDAPFLGSLPGDGISVDDIAGIVPTSDNDGYFLVGRDGGVFAFGDAPFLGSLPGEGIHLDDVVGIAATPSDEGYWVVAATGTVYSFGDATNFGSVSSPASSVSGIAATPDGGGYWVVTVNGSVYSFGDAGYFGSLPQSGVTPAHPVIGLVPTADDQGYWLIGSDGGIFAYGDAPFVGSLPGLGISVTDVVGAVPTRI